tara:strand:- start:175 stop:315 length:141 start_codon:yes stop_codon:yes gene_type:complete
LWFQEGIRNRGREVKKSLPNPHLSFKPTGITVIFDELRVFKEEISV